MTKRPTTGVRLFLSLVMTLAVTLGATIAVPSLAEARPRPRTTSNFQANKTFGLGFMLGRPTGLSGKYFLSSDNALDFGVGAVGGYGDRDGLHLHLDYLWHPVSLVSDPAFELPLYFGLGGRIWDFDDNDFDDDGFAFGIRAPLGIAFDLTNTPVDIFFELALVIDFYSGYRDNVGTDLNGAIGFRYYFN